MIDYGFKWFRPLFSFDLCVSIIHDSFIHFSLFTRSVSLHVFSFFPSIIILYPDH